MAVAVDTSGFIAGGSGGTSKNISGSYACSGSNRAVYVTVYVASDGTSAASVTYDGVAMTQLASKIVNNSNANYVAILFGLLNPPTGSKTVSVTATGGASITIVAADIVSVTGAGSLGTGVTAFGTGTTPAQSITGASGELIICGLVTQAASAISSFSQTSQHAGTLPVTGNGFVTGTAAGTGSATSFSGTATSGNWAAVGVSVPVPAASGAGNMFSMM